MAQKMEKKNNETHTAPDGGWGWMVVLGAALINTVNQALFSVFGLIFGETLKEMAHGKATGITLVMAVSVCVTNFSGLLVGPMMKRLSVMTITIFGVFCVSFGMVMSSFATEIWHIVISYGIFSGLGLGLVASSTFLAISEFFTTRKSTAVGLSMAGTSTGQMVMPIFVGILLKNYQFSGTTFILGCISACGIVGALLFKPLFCCKQRNPNTLENTKYDLNSNQSSTETPQTHKQTVESESLLKKETQIAVPETQSKTKGMPIVITSSESLSESSRRPTCLKLVAKTWDLHLLKDFKFVHMSLGLGLAYVSSVTFSTFFPMFLQDEVNFTMWETTTCMTALSAADIAGRLTTSEICRRFGLGNRSQFMLGALLLAVARSCLVYMTEYKMVLLFSVVVGYVRAVTVINQNLVISEYIPKSELPSAVGLNMVVKGFFVMTVGEPLGMLKDAFDYDVCIHLLDIILFCVFTSWSIEILIGKRRSRKTTGTSVA